MWISNRKIPERNNYAAYPSVAVIVPVFNERARLPKLLHALRTQNYPPEKMEVLFVDNGSTDGSVAYLKGAQERVFQSQPHRDADSARNFGWRSCQADLIAFTDADCTPEPDWLMRLVLGMHEEGAKCAAGKVLMNGPFHSMWQIYEAEVFLNHARSIAERGVAFTANLIVQRSWLENLGGFPEGLRSGGDYYFTKESTACGHIPVYFADAVVLHPNRKAWAILQKAYRIGWSRGQSFRRFGYLENLKTHHFRLKIFSLDRSRHRVANLPFMGIMLLVGLSAGLGLLHGLLSRSQYQTGKG